MEKEKGDARNRATFLAQLRSGDLVERKSGAGGERKRRLDLTAELSGWGGEKRDCKTGHRPV